MTRSQSQSAIENAEQVVEALATKGPQWWMSFIMLVLPCLVCVTLWWVAALLQTTIRQNTEALTRVAVALDRFESRH